MSFYRDKYHEHLKATGKSILEKDYATAFFHASKTAEFGLLLAERSEGKIADVYADSASDFIDTATKLKAKALNQDKNKTKKLVEEAASGNEEPKSGWELTDEIDTRFEHVGGLDEAKQIIIDSVIKPFQFPEVYERFKKKPGGGALLYGPPGTGKTFFARAIAGELDAKFFVVDCAMIKDKYVGGTEKNLKELFEQAASHEISVVFFDEVEALLSRRGNQKINTVTQFLSLTDGVSKNTNCILLLAATNKPWSLDDAAIRPGRLYPHVYVGLPNVVAREVILNTELKDVPVSSEVSISEIAESTQGYSGADIQSLCSNAIKPATDRQIAENPTVIESGVLVEISSEDFKAALERTSPSVSQASLEKYEDFRASRNVPVGDAASD